MAESPKQAELMVICQKPETKQFIILMADIPEQAAHLISLGNGSLAFMAGLNKIMKDDEIGWVYTIECKMNGFYNFCSKHIWVLIFINASLFWPTVVIICDQVRCTIIYCCTWIKFNKFHSIHFIHITCTKWVGTWRTIKLRVNLISFFCFFFVFLGFEMWIRKFSNLWHGRTSSNWGVKMAKKRVVIWLMTK